ncbi:MAG: zonular occludens toxin domain-containing protein [Sulfolobaceae archaeon]
MNRFVLYAIIIIIVFMFLRKKYHAVSIHGNSVICFTGGLGSGKTFSAVRYAIKLYHIQMFFHKIKLRRVKPYIISNIPIRVSKNEWAVILTREHLLMQEELPQGAIIVIDEIGSFADQYSYDNPNVMGTFTELVRFYRHYINGKFIFTDQSISNVIFSVKRRTVINYCLESFRAGLIIPTYTIKCSVQKVVDGEVLNVNNLDRDVKTDYLYGLMPFWRRYKNYDTRCYSDNYKPVKPFNPAVRWSYYKTDYVIDLSATAEEVKEFKKTRLGNILNSSGSKLDLSKYDIAG